MKKIMLINAVDQELSRMAVLESGKLKVVTGDADKN